MDRLALFVVACFAQVGCQTPYFPLTGQSTRLPPPATGAIGSGDYYSAPTPPPSAGSYIPPNSVHGEYVTNVGPWRYWESAADRAKSNALRNAPTRNATTSVAMTNRTQPQAALPAPASSTKPRLTRNDRLSWRDPYQQSPNSTGTYSQIAQSGGTATSSSLGNRPVGSSYVAPRLLPETGTVAPIASAPLRARFPGSYNRREVSVVPQLAEYLDGGVRQASATGTWHAPRGSNVQR